LSSLIARGVDGKLRTLTWLLDAQLVLAKISAHPHSGHDLNMREG
jgi:hypothetical protein